MTVIIKTSFYYGPLEILLKWLLSKELDPFKIKISVLADEFLNYYLKNQQVSFKDALEFLYALTFFLVYKTHHLFEKFDGDEEEVEKKEEVTISFIEIIEFLNERYEKMSKMYGREGEESLDYDESFDPSLLFSLFTKLIQKLPELKEKLEEIPKIEEKIDYILKELEKNEIIFFSNLILGSKSKIEAIVMFLALLELIRLRKILCIQEKIFDDIIIKKRNEV